MAAKVALDMVGSGGGRERGCPRRRGKERKDKDERDGWIESGRRKKWIAEESKIDAEAETNQRAAIR